MSVCKWMIVDYKLFKAGEDLPANTLWILEQIPYDNLKSLNFS